jgi:hypothetical protein
VVAAFDLLLFVVAMIGNDLKNHFIIASTHFSAKKGVEFENKPKNSPTLSE